MSPWTTDMDEMLKTDRQSGMSFGRIAYRISHAFQRDVTRSAVIGRADRLGLPKVSGYPTKLMRKAAGRKKQQRLENPTPWRVVKYKSPPLKLKPEPLPAPSEFDVARIKHNDLEKEHCRYPVGDPQDFANFGYCGLLSVPGMSWCRVHLQRCMPTVYAKRFPETEPAEKVLVEA